MATYLLYHHTKSDHVVKRNILRGYLVVLKGTGNHADKKTSEPVEPDILFSSVK